MAFPLSPKANDSYRYYDSASELTVPVKYEDKGSRDGQSVYHYTATATGPVKDHNLLKVLPAAMADRTLTRERVALIQTILAREPAAAAAQRHVINPVRARILPAGAAIMDAILQRYAATSIRVSESGVREGAILAVEHAGPAWRDRLADLAHGWRT